MSLTLQAWAARRYEPVPKPKTLRLWARTGRINPAPVKQGREWRVDENAEYVERPVERPDDKGRPYRQIPFSSSI